MSPAPRPHNDAADQVPSDLEELSNLVTGLPCKFRNEIEPVLTRVVESTKRRRRILTLVQDALSQLRLDMKYLVFDLEATRRERDHFRRVAEGTNIEDE